MDQNYQDTIPPVEPTSVMTDRWKSIAGAGTLSSVLSMISLVLGIFITVLVLVIAYFSMSMAYSLSRNRADEGLSPEVGVLLVGFVIIFLLMAPMTIMQFFHLQFTTKLKNAVALNDQVRFEAAWSSLRWYWRIFGALMVLLLIGFYFSGLTFGDIITVLIRIVNPEEMLNNF